MATLKKFSFYQLFPIISVTCLFLAKLYEDNYPYRNTNRIIEHIYFTLLYQGALFFFIAYLIPLFLSLKVKENTKRILKISSIFFVSFYLLISSYLFYSTNSSILLWNWKPWARPMVPESFQRCIKKSSLSARIYLVRQPIFMT